MSAFNRHLLLARRNPDITLGPFDGRVAALVKDFVCRTPNQDQIFLPPMQRREVHLRADLRYGPDDPTLWPQPWIGEYCHLGAIPRKPDNPNDSLSIMWWNPTRDDFESFNGGIVDGLGELSRPKLFSLKALMMILEGRIEDYKKNAPKPNNLLLSLLKAMQDAYIRLASLKTTFFEMRFGITEFQRYYLELRGCLDYLEIYKLRMDGQKPAAETVANCVGAFTNIARVVQDFHTAGLPIWFLQPTTVWNTPVECNILEIVTPLNPADVLCVSQHDPPIPPIFCGFATNPNRHAAIHSYSRTWLVFKDPFGGETLKPSTIQSADHDQISPVESLQSSARVSLASKPQTIQTVGRDKFSPLNKPFAPFSIPAWSAALQAVDQSPSRLIQASKMAKHYGRYTFPDPGLFVNPTTAPKYLQSWLQVRDAWFMRVVKEPFLAMANQNWRTFLSTALNVPENGNTKAARRRQESVEMIMPKSNMYPEVKMRSGLAGPIIWQGKEYPPEVLPPDDVVREILWELFEVNFIHELQSLDRRACADLDLSDTTQLFQRQIMISRCFHSSSFRHVPIPSQNLGLAADDLDNRFHFIINLALVMKSWRGDKPVLLSTSADGLRGLSRTARGVLEQRIAKYYCQQFFNYFGRAAQIPHRLFNHK